MEKKRGDMLMPKMLSRKSSRELKVKLIMLVTKLSPLDRIPKIT